MKSLPPLAWLRSFEAAARHGGFAAAAEELGLTPAAVSQQIRALEARLGFPLFRRLPRGVALNEMGQAYLPSVRRAFEELSTATAGLFGPGRAEMVVVRAPPSFAALRLAPVLGRFREARPDVPLRLSTSIWAEASDEDRVDIDIRYGDGRWAAPGSHRLTEPVSCLVAAPGGAPAPGEPAALLKAVAPRAIHVAGCESLWHLAARRFGLDPGSTGTGLGVDSSLVALEMVAAGLGVALIARDLAQPYLEAGRVVCPGPIEIAHDEAHYAVLTEAGRTRPEACLFRDWLVAEFTG
ncbi:LysR substrate-binding domain-containing protein [Rhodosalinus sp. FB01]|uniref:LysR substrate-binding domain-containing protein n=1 Tax=Rhodosalinus sp. FB01 TaxID=3239194 RepID=UPI003525A885